jgi:pimeloyl-ACP methyl ester carboxylesterase
MIRVKTRAALSAAVVALAACQPDSVVDPGSARLAPNVTLSSQIVDGSFGPGALYRLARPANWNGDLLVYAHGYVSPDQPVALPPEGDLFINLFGAQGIAVAFTSYSENGWAVKDGAQRTHQLLGIFNSKFGKPNRVYLGGASMGGMIAIKLVETYPNAYVGALSACAVSGGTRAQLDYHAHVRALFDFFYPGVLPGNAGFLPPGTDVTQQIILPAIAAMTANPSAALSIALVDQAPVPFADPNELVQSIVTALAAQAGDLTETVITKGKPYFENRNTTYSSALLPPAVVQAINAAIGRFAASPSALAALDHNYTPSGDLRVPMLMLSEARDPIAPGFHRASYLAAVTANGASNLLVQRTIPRYGHCTFTPAEIGAAFTDLVLWVRFGIKPTP